MHGGVRSLDTSCGLQTNYMAKHMHVTWDCEEHLSCTRRKFTGNIMRVKWMDKLRNEQIKIVFLGNSKQEFPSPLQFE